MKNTNFETEIGILKDWINTTREWLHKDDSPNAIRPPHQQLLDKVEQSKEEKRTNRVWESLEEMETLTTRISDTREQGEIIIACARIAAELENIKEALRLVQAAENKYKSYPHQRAVALWMSGCIYWSIGSRINAITAWEEAIALFRDRELSVRVSTNKVQWYKDMIPKLEAWLSDAIEKGDLPRVAQLPAKGSDKSQAKDMPFESVINPNGEQDLIKWISCAISDSVPAGGFGPVGYDPKPNSCLEIKEVVIENETYRIINTQRSSTSKSVSVSIRPEEKYHTVLVNGNSMNMAKPVPIKDGDYVLVCVQNTAVDNDIVVAKITGLDNGATIKRLKIRNSKIVLIPESDSEYATIDPEMEFSNFDDKFAIYGVVKAIFKKK